MLISEILKAVQIPKFSSSIREFGTPSNYLPLALLDSFWSDITWPLEALVPIIMSAQIKSDLVMYAYFSIRYSVKIFRIFRSQLILRDKLVLLTFLQFGIFNYRALFNF